MIYKFINDFKIQVFVIIGSCLLLYSNTIRNTYALDDEMVILKNLNVQKGFGGIKKIFKTDAYQGYYDMMDAASPLSGGRYRPLSIATFAVEQELFGETYGLEFIKIQKELVKLQQQNTSAQEMSDLIKKKNLLQSSIVENNLKIAPHRHMIQVALFILSMVALLFFMNRYIFPSSPLLGFFTVLLFVFHPVHTEVVANIKSRDEIISLLFIALTGIFLFRYHQVRTTKTLVLCLVCFTGALLSKEYAVVVPFVLVAGILILYKSSFKNLLHPGVIGMFIMLFIFIIIRFSAFNNISKGSQKDVLNEPYLFATAGEKVASKIGIILQYFRVLIYPKDLSYDYSYNQLPYLNFDDWQVWVSILLYAAITFLTWHLFRKRHIMGFALILFISFFMLVNNLLFPIGATMGERLIYHSSLGFCMAVVWGIYYLIEKLKMSHAVKQIVVTGLCIVVLIPMTAKTISRNQAWESDYTLSFTDVATVPGSALANSNAGSVRFNAFLKKWLENNNKTAADSALFRKHIDTSIYYFNKSVVIHPAYLNSHINLGLCYFYLNDMTHAADYWEKAANLFNGPHPLLRSHSRLFLDRGLDYGSKKQYSQAVTELTKASAIYPYDADIWNNLGGSLFMMGKFKEAKEAFSKSLDLNPSLVDSQQGQAVAENFYTLQKKTEKDSLNVSAWLEAGNIYKQNNLFLQAEDAYAHVLRLDKGNSLAKKELGAIRKHIAKK